MSAALAPALEASRAELLDLLGPLEAAAAVWPTLPDATSLPAVWIDQPAGGLSGVSGVVTAAWSVVCAVDPGTAASADALDLLAGAAIALAVGASSFRLIGWTRGQAEVGGAPVPSVTVDLQSDHVIC